MLIIAKMNALEDMRIIEKLYEASCAGVKIVGDSKGQVAAIEKSPCFGKCPVYTMQIFKDGKVLYEGRMNTKKLGTFQKNIT